MKQVFSKNKIIQLLVLVLVSAFSACSSDNEEDLLGELEIKDISFAEQILPLVESNCYGCHSMANSSIGAGIVLEGYDAIKVQIDADKFLQVLRAEGDLSQMPPGAPLTETQILTVETWINEGALMN